MQRVLIIGGTGSWGQELTRQLLLRNPHSEITIYSRGEHRQVDMARAFNDRRIRFIVGDIRDKYGLSRATAGMDIVYHLAALKHVPVCERNPSETIKTNIIGTQNAVEAATEREVKRFVFVSTDKAVDPINVYGVSKSMAEKVVTGANDRTDRTVFVCIRGGNVLGTQGSVVPLFKEQIIRANEITITHPDMTRYLMRVEEAIALLFRATEDAHGGEIFVMKMPSVRVTDIAAVMVRSLGNRETKTRYIGMRPGEKMHEALVCRQESLRAFTHGDYYVILPTMDVRGVYSKWRGCEYVNQEYTSEHNRFLTQEEIYETLQKDSWLNPVPVSALEHFTKEELLDFFRKEGWAR